MKVNKEDSVLQRTKVPIYATYERHSSSLRSTQLKSSLLYALIAQKVAVVGPKREAVATIMQCDGGQFFFCFMKLLLW